MAYLDQNGKITIDEIAAKKDVTDLRQSSDDLKKALELLNQIQAIASEFEGNTANAIDETSRNFKREIEKLVLSIDDSIETINKTLAKYKSIDETLKRHIEG